MNLIILMALRSLSYSIKSELTFRLLLVWTNYYVIEVNTQLVPIIIKKHFSDDGINIVNRA